MTSNSTFDLLENVTCPRRGAAYLPTVRLIIGHYVFPWLLIIGITGNILNLLVLNSRGMRTKTNVLLSAMAVADLFFFSAMFPLELQVFNSVASKNWYRFFFAHHKMTLTFLSNWFANASTWMALAVTAERVFAIKMPLHAKFYWKKKRIAVLIFSIFATTLLMHLYNFFWFRLTTRPVYCSDGSLAYDAYLLTPVTRNDSVFVYYYVQASHIFVPHLSITFPFFVLFILNAFLLYYLHQNRRAMADATNAPQLRHNELKVALMVALIVLTFILCSATSVALYIYDAVVTFALRTSPYTATFFNISTVSNCLVVVGKASNFVLYCSASSHFRRRLARMFCKRYAPPMVRGSSRASTSQRRTTLTSLFATAIAELQFHHSHHHNNNHLQQHPSHQRNSMGTCCAIAAGAHSSNRRASNKSQGSIENLIEMKTPPSITSDRSNKTFRQPKDLLISNQKRRHSSQIQSQQNNQRRHPTKDAATSTLLLLEKRRFSSPDQGLK